MSHTDLTFDGLDLPNHGLTQTFQLAGCTTTIDLEVPAVLSEPGGMLGAGYKDPKGGTLKILNGMNIDL